MSNRRDFISLLGGAAAWPLAARAQQPERMRRIGVLLPNDENDPQAKTSVSAFTQAFANVANPVASGIVLRRDRPSGNSTGFANFEYSLGGKWLELLSEIAPGLKR